MKLIFIKNNYYLTLISRKIFIGDWGLGPIPNPQSPIPNPQSPLHFVNFIFKKKI